MKKRTIIGGLALAFFVAANKEKKTKPSNIFYAEVTKPHVEDRTPTDGSPGDGGSGGTPQY